MRPSDGGGGRHFNHRSTAQRRAAAKRSAPLPEKLTPVKRADVMDQVPVQVFAGPRIKQGSPPKKLAPEEASQLWIR